MYLISNSIYSNILVITPSQTQPICIRQLSKPQGKNMENIFIRENSKWKWLKNIELKEEIAHVEQILLLVKMHLYVGKG